MITLNRLLQELTGQLILRESTFAVWLLIFPALRLGNFLVWHVVQRLDRQTNFNSRSWGM